MPLARAQAARAHGLARRDGVIVILGISVDSGQARGVLMDTDGTVRARAESTAPADCRCRRRRGTRGARGEPQRRGRRRLACRFPNPDSKNWPSDWSFLSGAVGEAVPVRTLSTGNASALAEVWYGAGKQARDLIAFSLGPCVSAGIVSNGVLLAGRARPGELGAVAGAESRRARRLPPHGMPGSRRRRVGHRAAAGLARQVRRPFARRRRGGRRFQRHHARDDSERRRARTTACRCRSSATR